MDSFMLYIDKLGTLDDNDLYLDIDETMEKREKEKPKVAMTGSYAPKKTKG